MKLFFKSLWWIESCKEQFLFEIELFCYIVNVSTVTLNCDQIYVFLINDLFLIGSVHFKILIF